MRSAHATWREVPYTGLHARQPHRAVIAHTNGGGTDHGSLFGWWSGIARKGQHIGAHFQIATSGHAEQYVDTDHVVYHAYAASEWAVGIETEDDGHPATPWTDPQLATIIAICKELHIPGRLLTTPQPADGIGWHEMFVDWNHDGHTCPGRVREQQIRTVIVPALIMHSPAQPHVITADDVTAAKKAKVDVLTYLAGLYPPDTKQTLLDINADAPWRHRNIRVGDRVKVRTG